MAKLNKEITKEVILATLQEEFTVKATCKKLNISRQTFYRWIEQFRIEDKNVDQEVAKAIKQGVQNINDYAENQLVQKVYKGDMNAIKFWLKHRHDDYKQAYIIQN